LAAVVIKNIPMVEIAFTFFITSLHCSGFHVREKASPVFRLTVRANNLAEAIQEIKAVARGEIISGPERVGKPQTGTVLRYAFIIMIMLVNVIAATASWFLIERLINH
jgi:hypothetical protein